MGSGVGGGLMIFLFVSRKPSRFTYNFRQIMLGIYISTVGLILWELQNVYLDKNKIINNPILIRKNEKCLK